MVVGSSGWALKGGIKGRILFGNLLSREEFCRNEVEYHALPMIILDWGTYSGFMYVFGLFGIIYLF